VHTKNVGVAADTGSKSILENPREFSPAWALYTYAVSSSEYTEILICFPLVLRPLNGKYFSHHLLMWFQKIRYQYKNSL
jgi:hypothetical protein